MQRKNVFWLFFTMPSEKQHDTGAGKLKSAKDHEKVGTFYWKSGPL